MPLRNLSAHTQQSWLIQQAYNLVKSSSLFLTTPPKAGFVGTCTLCVLACNSLEVLNVLFFCAGIGANCAIVLQVAHFALLNVGIMFLQSNPLGLFEVLKS